MLAATVFVNYIFDATVFRTPGEAIGRPWFREKIVTVDWAEGTVISCACSQLREDFFRRTISNPSLVHPPFQTESFCYKLKSSKVFIGSGISRWVCGVKSSVKKKSLFLTLVHLVVRLTFSPFVAHGSISSVNQKHHFYARERLSDCEGSMC